MYMNSCTQDSRNTVDEISPRMVYSRAVSVSVKPRDL